MLPGYNHNVRRGAHVLHVQTEDSGVAQPHVLTHAFIGGNVVATLRCEYGDLLDGAPLAARLTARMQQQHKAMLRAVAGGRYDADIARRAPSAAADAAPGAAADAAPGGETMLRAAAGPHATAASHDDTTPPPEAAVSGPGAVASAPRPPPLPGRGRAVQSSAAGPAGAAMLVGKTGAASAAGATGGAQPAEEIFDADALGVVVDPEGVGTERSG